MKKANRKLIPAVAMLLVSAIMLSTASFAWFSMNTTVSANGLTIKAETNEAFLQIANHVANRQASSKEDDYASSVTIADDEVDVKLHPVAPAEATVANASDATTHKVDGETTTLTSSKLKWYYATSEKTSDATAKEGTYSSVLTPDLTTAKNNKFLELNKVDIRLLNKTVKHMSADVGTVTIDTKSLESAEVKLLQAVRVLFVNGDNYVLYSFAGQTAGDNGTVVTAVKSAYYGDHLIADVAFRNTNLDTDRNTVDVYVYFDGEDPNCFTDNAHKMPTAGYDISFTMTAAEGGARE